jgi:DNA-binding transcriptional LysR family regulator
MKLAWDDFKLVKAIMDSSGLTGAAQTLDVNHSTVFRRLGQIEAELGLPLFERRKTGYVATPAGEEMAALATRMEEDINGFGRRIIGREIAPAGEVRLTTSDTLYLHLLLPIIASFRDSYPAIRLDLVLGNQALNLSRRDADVAVRATDMPPETLVGRRICTIAWAIYTQAGDPTPALDVTLDTASFERNWVCLGDVLGHVKAARFVRERVPTEKIAMRVSAVLGMAEAIESGVGIGPLPCFIGDQNPKLRRLSPPNPDFGTGLWILTHPDLRQAPRVRALMDYFSQEISRRRKLVEGLSPYGTPAIEK